MMTRQERQEQKERMERCRQQGQQEASEINQAIQAGAQIVIQTGFGPHRITGVNGNYDIWSRPFDPVSCQDTGDCRWFMGCRDGQWQDMVDAAREGARQ